MFFAKGSTSRRSIGPTRSSVLGAWLAGVRSFASVRRVASNFLQHCKKWMRDGFASSSSSSSSSSPPSLRLLLQKPGVLRRGAPRFPLQEEVPNPSLSFLAALHAPGGGQPIPDRVLRRKTRIKTARRGRDIERERERERERGREGGKGVAKKSQEKRALGKGSRLSRGRSRSRRVTF